MTRATRLTAAIHGAWLRSVRCGSEPDFTERIFSQIEGFGSYGSPESAAADDGRRRGG
jgi:hypothetical protein